MELRFCGSSHKRSIKQSSEEANRQSTNLGKCYKKPSCSENYLCNPHCLRHNTPVKNSVRFFQVLHWRYMIFKFKNTAGKAREWLTRLRPIISVIHPLTKAPINPPIVNVEPKSEYCDMKNRECQYWRIWIMTHKLPYYNDVTDKEVIVS